MYGQLTIQRIKLNCSYTQTHRPEIGNCPICCPSLCFVAQLYTGRSLWPVGHISCVRHVRCNNICRWSCHWTSALRLCAAVESYRIDSSEEHVARRQHRWMASLASSLLEKKPVSILSVREFSVAALNEQFAADIHPHFSWGLRLQSLWPGVSAQTANDQVNSDRN